MGTLARVFYATLVAYLIHYDPFPGVNSSPTPSWFWSTETASSSSSAPSSSSSSSSSYSSSYASTTVDDQYQDGGYNSSSSYSPFDMFALCHPSCDCLDTYFDCKKRGLTEFPAEFPTFVERLNLSNNEIEYIQEYRLSRLKKLQNVSLDSNNLTAIPAASGLDDLVHLSLSRNQISSVEESQLTRFKSLRELDLSRNRIEFLSNNSFPTNSSLHNVNLGANQIESLESGCFLGLQYLQELSLQRNKIRALPKELFSPLKNLERLDLSRNKLDTMDSLRFQELKRLHILNLRRNHMSNLSDAAFYGLEKIQQLYLDENNIRIVEKRWLYGLRSLDTLNLSRNQIIKIEDDSWEYMEELQILDLSYNQIHEISKRSMLGLGRLKTLNLSFNKLVSIEEETFLPLEKLEFLDLSNNELSWVLEDMTAPFKGLGSLHTLNLASNRFQSLHPKALTGLVSLKTLNLSANPITWISQKPLQEVPAVNLLLSEVHSLACDCETLWLQSHLAAVASLSSTTSNNNNGMMFTMMKHNKHRNRNNRRPITKNGPFCAFPPQHQGKSLMEIPAQELACSERPLRPVFLLQPETQTLLMEGSGHLSCHVESFASTPPNVVWKKDHKELPKQLEAQVVNLERSLSNGSIQINSTLQLKNVSWADVGTYQCIAKNHLGIVYSTKANVTVHSFPVFVKKPQNVTVRLGSSAKFECSAKGSPAPEIVFSKDDGVSFHAAEGRRFHFIPLEDAFIIMDVKLSDRGVYACSAKNNAGEIKTYATVTVFETPSFRETMEDEKAVEGSNAILECSANGSPQPMISWSKDNVAVTNGSSDRYQFKDNGVLLIIKNVQLEDAGRYECLISNAIGSARDSSYLTVIPSSNAKNLSLAVPEMTIIFVVIAFFCVVGTSAAWFVFFYRTRRKQQQQQLHHQSSQILENSALRRHSVARYEDMDDTFASPHSIPIPNYQITKSHCEDDGSQSSSGKDSGTGDDLTVEVDAIGVPDPEEESLMRYSRRKPEMESFSTFGTRAPTARLSQVRLDMGRNEVGDVISLAHHPGREFLTMPRKYPVPVPPPLVVLPRDHLDVTDARSGCQSTTSSSGYSTLGLRTPAGQAKNRSHSVNSDAESLGGGLLATSGCDSESSSDALSTKEDDMDSQSQTDRRISKALASEQLSSYISGVGSAVTSFPSETAANHTNVAGSDATGGRSVNGGVITSISTPV